MSDGDVVLEAFSVTGVLESLQEGLQVLAPDWRYLYVNEAVARHGRKAREELLGRTMLECYPGIENTPMFATLERCMRERVSEAIESEFSHEDGERSWFELRIQPCQEGLVVLSLDVTARKRLESAVRQAHKLRALGEMAVGVVHDLRNLLNPIGLNVEVLRRELASHSEALEVLDDMAGVVRRGAQTIDRLKRFARQTPEVTASTLDLGAVAREAHAICKPRVASCERPVRIHEELADSAIAHVDASELLDGIVNLVFNAIDAMPGGGAVTLRTGSSEDEAWIEVEDTGGGMSAEVQAKAFQPFFTTKGHGGTGMGLSMVYALTARHHGSAHLRSSPGEGTTVTLRFPRAPHGEPGVSTRLALSATND